MNIGKPLNVRAGIDDGHVITSGFELLGRVQPGKSTTDNDDFWLNLFSKHVLAPLVPVFQTPAPILSLRLRILS